MVGTMGVALTVCTVPGQNPSDRLGPGKMELGLGIVSISLHVMFNAVVLMPSGFIKTSRYPSG